MIIMIMYLHIIGLQVRESVVIRIEGDEVFHLPNIELMRSGFEEHEKKINSLLLIIIRK
jgi:hypothetical protein